MCRWEGCERDAVAQGLCLMHYKRAKRSGEIQRVIKPKTGLCEVNECECPVYADGKCQRHYRQIQRKENEEKCKVEGCGAPHLALGYCLKHYQQYQKYGEQLGYKPKKEKPPKVRKRPERVRGCVKCGEVKIIHGLGFCRSCYRKENSWERRNYDHVRRTKIKSTAKKFTKQQVLDKTNGHCGICGKAIDLSLKLPNVESFSIDHILPVSKGGTHTLDNVQPAHWICNCLKQAKIMNLTEEQ